MRVNPNDFALFDYEQNPLIEDTFQLGDVVINKDDEIGVIIQCHGNDEYRTDQFGNCCYSPDSEYSDLCGKADAASILMFRASLLDHKNLED